MRSEARLDAAVFQLTPTRTRCDLVIIANGKTEKLASGLLKPFLPHLKTAQDQIAKGGYSITLEPDPATDAFWFTKNTVERFVRFVSTPEVLERVATIESEILQIHDAIIIQGNESLGFSTLEDHQTKSTRHIEGSKPVFDADAEKAIVLYKPGLQSNPPESNGSDMQEENSKVQLLRVLETRMIVLQKEQGMAFARAVAAGFDMDHMSILILFAECFGASRLKEACLRFMELWKVKHETGQWIEVEASEATSTRSGFSPFNASGIVLAGDARKQKEFGEASPASGGDLGIESNGNDVTEDHSSDTRFPSDHHVPPGPHKYFQGQFQRPTFPAWAMHPPSGSAVFQPYPMQGMPYYQNYPGSGPFYPPPYPSAEVLRFDTHQRVGRRQSMNSKDTDVYPEIWEDDVDRSLSESDKGTSHGHKSHKRGGQSGKKKDGVVVIRNINYVTSKKHGKSCGESQSASNSDTEDESEDFHSDTAERKHEKSSRSSKKNDDRKKTSETSNAHDGDEVVYDNDADSGNWQAFQSFLLRAEEKITSTTDGDIIAGEREPSIKRRQNFIEAEPILNPQRDFGNNHEARNLEIDSANGKGSRTRKLASNDELLTSNKGRGLRESHVDAQFIEVEGGGGGYRRVTTDDFMTYGLENQISSKSSSGPLADGYDYGHPSNKEKSSYVATDESFIVPFRSGSTDQLEIDNRTAIDMDSEIPIYLQRKEDSCSNANNRLTYEPDDLTMLPERAFESDYIGYDPAMDYDIEMPIEVSVKQETKDEEDVSTITNEELKKSDKEKKSKVPHDGLEKRRRDAMARRGVSSMSNPLTEAQKRAEKLRAYKVDLQKVKKANEEEERKRLEALKIQRQKRIAARNNSNSVQSPLATKQARSGFPSKVSPSSVKGSKFSDSELGSNSSLQKLPIGRSSIGPNDSQKSTKTGRVNGTTNGLNKSVSSLPDLKNETNVLIPKAKTPATRNKRLSDSNVKNVQHSSQKSVAADQIPNRTSANGPQMKNISAIVQLDKTKSATLPELKIRTPIGHLDTIQNRSVTEDILQEGPKSTQSSGSVQENDNTENPLRARNSDDNLVIDKTVVMLENEMITGPAFKASEGIGALDEAKEKAGPASEYVAIRAPPSPITVGEAEDSSHHKPGEHLDCYEVVNNMPTDGYQNFSNSVTENFYQAPYATATSLEDPAASNPNVAGASNDRLELASNSTESIKGCVKISESCLMDQINGSIEKPRIKESKGFIKLLKFGRKNHSSASGEGNMDSDGSVADDKMEAGSSNDVHILKNLISQDDSHAGGTPPRGHRSFSILSPFRSSRSNEKKLAA